MKPHAWFAVLALGSHLGAAEGPVRVWETNLVIPTYLAAPPSPVPRFYEGRTYQGAKATFYPYPVQDVLTDVKSNVTYTAVYLENDFLQIAVIPQLGGRIWSAVDKSNGYDFFYRQHVVKPALIGMLGAWISGGVEWNVPHHHRATSFAPVDCTTTTNADGSATIWVGEIELRHRMKWLVGLTLYPDRSYLELTCRMFNRTPFAHPMLFWINAAVHANDQYQVIFPPGTEWAAQHSKPEFASWPIAHQTYGGTDYTRGVDISWWKNHPNPVSFFCWNYQDDWFGGYDHGKQAGVVHVADHHVAPGKKFFEWGNGPEGEMWSKILTDDDGPYLELMAGAWSDNQPDYSWIQPGETREWKHWWYPVRNMRGVKAATRDAAMNVQVTNGVARIAINATREISGAEVLAGNADKAWFQKRVDVGPHQPFVAEAKLPDGVNEGQFFVALLTTNRQGVVVYLPAKRLDSPVPAPVEKPKSPKDYATADELYFTGQRIEQLYSPSFEARTYYEEMLRRDPGDYRANTALGILLCQQWRWAEAATCLSNAVARATANYIRPKDGEAFYYLGVALKAQGQHFAAEESLRKAAWSPAWQSAAGCELAELALQQVGVEEVLRQGLRDVDLALNAADNNLRARNLKSAILRKLGQPEAAERLAVETLALDPLNVRAASEQILAQRQRGAPEWRDNVMRLRQLMGRNPEAFTELTTELASEGQWSEVTEILRDQVKAAASGDAAIVASEPYLLAYALQRAGQTEAAAAQLAAAAQTSTAFCFPSRFEEEPVLRFASEQAPQDANAAYLLGCLLYDNQPENAIKAWEQSRRRNDKFALTHRNLALAYAQHEKDIPKAIASLERAVELNPTEPRFLYELDVQYEAGGAPVAQRLAMLTNHHAVVAGRDDALTREIVLLTVAGQPERALALLRGRRFHNWEGSSQIHNVYVDACLARGQQLLAEGKPREALAAFEAARDYPENLEVGPSRWAARSAQIEYCIGKAQEALADDAAAKRAFEAAAAGRGGGASEADYFRARALRQLGRGEEAEAIFERLVKAGESQLAQGESADYFAKFGEKSSDRVRKAGAHYLIGLGKLGLGDAAAAAEEFRCTLQWHPAHLGAQLWARP